LDLGTFVAPQEGATYADQLAAARMAEACGLGAFVRSDHILANGDEIRPPGPTDAWITLAGLARETATIRIGTLVSEATFRLPAHLAIIAA
jgi:alkanesulfonate monooxygenase